MSQETTLPLDAPPVPSVEVAPPVVEIAAPQALVSPGVSSVTFRDQQVEQGLINQIAAMEQAMEAFETRSRLIETCRLAAIRATSPTDWVLFRDKQGNATAMLCASGSNVVAQYYGIEVFNMRPIKNGIFQPDQETDRESKETRYSCWFDARSAVTGQAVKDVEAGRSSTEQFIGRAALDSTSGLVKMADLRAACYTLARTKAARILGAMVRLPLDVLEKAWADTSKKVADCRKGSGYGTSTQRGAQSVTSDEVKVAAKNLADEVLSRVGGDMDAAKKLMKEITSNPPKFDGFDSATRLTKGWQIENAWKKLNAHEVFGGPPAEGKK